MYTKPAPRTNQQSLFFDLESQLNQKHPLYLLANKIDWNVFEEAFKGLYCANNGRPAKPIRRMVGLMILKHVRNVSDESVVEQWQENIYYQYFCGEQSILYAMLRRLLSEFPYIIILQSWNLLLMYGDLPRLCLTGLFEALLNIRKSVNVWVSGALLLCIFAAARRLDFIFQLLE